MKGKDYAHTLTHIRIHAHMYILIASIKCLGAFWVHFWLGHQRIINEYEHILSISIHPFIHPLDHIPLFYWQFLNLFFWLDYCCCCCCCCCCWLP